jgi:LacI family transcriptional regulator
MMASPARLSDVAKRAGVSAATVSRVINDHPAVDPDLARRVRQAIKELDYRPNILGRQLRQQRSSFWVAIISDIENPFFTGLIRGLEDVAAAAGMSVVLCNADEDVRKERTYIELAIAQQAAGLVIAPASERATSLDGLVDARIPVVAVDRLPPDRSLDQGYQRVALLGGPTSVTTARQRKAGYRKGLRERGLRHEPALEVAADFRVEGGYAAMKHLLAQDLPPDAVVVANNLMALGALQVVRETRIRVPRDLGFVTFDELPGTTINANTTITAIRQPLREIGRTAGQLLAERMANPSSSPIHRVLEAELVVGGSSQRVR